MLDGFEQSTLLVSESRLQAVIYVSGPRPSLAGIPIPVTNRHSPQSISRQLSKQIHYHPNHRNLDADTETHHPVSIQPRTNQLCACKCAV